MSDSKYQAENPPVTYQAPLPVMAMTITQPEQTFEVFDKKKAKGLSITLLVLGCIAAILSFFILHVFSVFVFPIPIIAGILGILSSIQAANWKIISFMVLSIISAVISIIMTIVYIGAIVGGVLITQESIGENLGISVLIIGALGAIFNVAMAIVSIFCSVLASRQVGCCGCCDQNKQFQGVVHGKIDQSVTNMKNLPPGGQYMQFQNSPPHPPPYNQVILQA